MGYGVFYALSGLEMLAIVFLFVDFCFASAWAILLRMALPLRPLHGPVDAATESRWKTAFELLSQNQQRPKPVQIHNNRHIPGSKRHFRFLRHFRYPTDSGNIAGHRWV